MVHHPPRAQAGGGRSAQTLGINSPFFGHAQSCSREASASALAFGLGVCAAVKEFRNRSARLLEFECVLCSPRPSRSTPWLWPLAACCLLSTLCLRFRPLPNPTLERTCTGLAREPL